MRLERLLLPIALLLVPADPGTTDGATFPRAGPPPAVTAVTAVAARPLLEDNQVIAFYGNPNSRRMGILGEYPKEDLARLLAAYARLYDEANGKTGVVPAFHLVYGTCWPGGEIGYLDEATVIDYIEFARSRGMAVILDHQIGRYGVRESLERMLPFLRWPNVHLALDPEWRTEAPMEEIGSISAEELNEAQGAMSAWLAGPGECRMLVVHQFRNRMIEGRERVRADFPGVTLVHTADGFGPPDLKRDAYARNAGAENMPVKGFKLFLRTDVEGAGWDEPLLTPPEVLSLQPRPSLVIYQ